MIRLYVIDDHYLIVEGLYSTFNPESNDFTVTGGSQSMTEALEKISPETVDIIVLDLFINHSDPVSNFKQIQDKFPSIPIVILSYEDCLMWQVKMFRQGIRAFISKNENRNVMREKLHRVFAGEIVLPHEVSLMFIRENCSEDSPPIVRQEYMEIINGMVNGLNKKQIAAQLNQSESAIDKKLQKIRQCFKVNTNYELIYKAFVKHPQYSDLF